MPRSPLLLAGLGAWLVLAGCVTRQPRRDPTGEVFPSVVGGSLAGDEVRVPEDFAGQPLILLVGYDQDAQFDADRWLLGLLQSEVDIPIRELPTIPGFAPRVFSGAIDSGMRGGIPEEDWASVVTVYGDAETIARFTGSEQDQNMRALLLDGEGRVVFFHDRGYSARTMLQMLEELARVRSSR